MNIRIPSFLRDVFGESPTLGELRIILLLGVGLATLMVQVLFGFAVDHYGQS